jgi:hypothetical protein
MATDEAGVLQGCAIYPELSQELATPYTIPSRVQGLNFNPPLEH